MATFAATTQPPKKRVKFDLQTNKDTDNDPAEIRPHPLRIKPSGNAFTATINLRDVSLGHFSVFPDELILQILGYLSEEELNLIGTTSKGLYGFSRCEELWKCLFIESPSLHESFTWHGTWRRTCLSLPPCRESRVLLPELFSDALYRPYHMSQISLAPFASKIPPQNQIKRLQTLSSVEFDNSYSKTPFILTSPVKDWLGYKSWTTESLVSAYGDVKFRAESVNWKLRDYVSYMENQDDESPLYLFDKEFIEKTKGEMEAGFTVPECFGRDFFEVLGDQRPDRRWMILGPRRSGSTFHKDPNATSAWNAVIYGEKYWIMFPPDYLPPGVFVSEDHSEVTSPLSIAEWLVSFHEAAREMPGCIEGICKAGEILHVPSGWWHLVVNLSPSLALTQNFVPKTQLPAAISFLRDQTCSISGFDSDKVKDPYKLFITRMENMFPQELKEANQKLEANTRSKWDDLVKAGSGFSFSFGGCGDSDDD
ncbi:putative F-box and JmjC domain protein [Geopyxis carbonaria]|nr:putative F-box and JmjC domain protein [Geopyxis carbonaria]